MKAYRTFSSAKTKKFGSEFAKHKTRTGNRKHALVFALSGDLGAGKTTFVQGFLSGIGVKRRSASPTFIIYRRFKLQGPRFKNVYHVDAYRIKKTRDLAALGFKDILSDPGNIVLIEWAENIRKILPRDVQWLKFKHGKKINERMIEYPNGPKT